MAEITLSEGERAEVLRSGTIVLSPSDARYDKLVQACREIVDEASLDKLQSDRSVLNVMFWRVMVPEIRRGLAEIDDA